MAIMPSDLRLSETEEAALKEIRRLAVIRHKKARKAAAKLGRKDFPDLPYECSWAFEMEFMRKSRKAGMKQVKR